MQERETGEEPNLAYIKSLIASATTNYFK